MQNKIPDPLLLEERAEADPLFLHHLEICSSDPDMLAILMRECVDDITPLPSNTSLARQVGSVLSKWAFRGFKATGKEEYQRRLAACATCPHLEDAPADRLAYKLIAASMNPGKICALCGCNIRRKAMVASESCPDLSIGVGGRW